MNESLNDYQVLFTDGTAETVRAESVEVASGMLCFIVDGKYIAEFNMQHVRGYKILE